MRDSIVESDNPIWFLESEVHAYWSVVWLAYYFNAITGSILVLIAFVQIALSYCKRVLSYDIWAVGTHKLHFNSHNVVKQLQGRQWIRYLVYFIVIYNLIIYNVALIFSCVAIRILVYTLNAKLQALLVILTIQHDVGGRSSFEVVALLLAVAVFVHDAKNLLLLFVSWYLDCVYLLRSSLELTGVVFAKFLALFWILKVIMGLNLTSKLCNN